MRRALLFLLATSACYAESDGSSDASPAETTSTPCTPGTESCACAPGGECEAELVCAGAQCIAPTATSTVTDASDTTIASSSDESTGTSGAATSTTETPGTSEVGSSDEGSTGSVCEGTCLECQTCALAGPCADESAACEGGACGDTPFCMMGCAQQQHSCDECCDAAMLGLAVELVQCFAAQCGDECAFSC